MKYLMKKYDDEVKFYDDEVAEAKYYWCVEEDCETLEDVAFYWNSEHGGDAEGELIVRG